MTLRN